MLIWGNLRHHSLLTPLQPGLQGSSSCVSSTVVTIMVSPSSVLYSQIQRVNASIITSVAQYSSNIVDLSISTPGVQPTSPSTCGISSESAGMAANEMIRSLLMAVSCSRMLSLVSCPPSYPCTILALLWPSLYPIMVFKEVEISVAQSISSLQVWNHNHPSPTWYNLILMTGRSIV